MTHSPAKKLTDCPSNLKEAIDWILRVTGKDGQNGPGIGTDNVEDLAQAVCELPGFATVIVGAVRDKERGPNGVHVEVNLSKLNDTYTLSHIITDLAEGSRVFIGYDKGRRGTIEGTGIADVPKKNKSKPYDSLEDWRRNGPDGYFLSYPPEATWHRDVMNARENGGPSKAKVKCAIILLGCMPLFYYGLTYLACWCGYEMHDAWNNKQFDGKDEGKKLGGEGALSKFMQAMGYQWTSLSKSKCGHVMNRVASSLQDLKVSAYGGYSEFIRQIEKNGNRNIETTAIMYPLYGLYFVASAYFKFQLQYGNITAGIDELKKTLEQHEKPYSITGENPYQALETCIADLMNKMKLLELVKFGTYTASGRTSGSSNHGAASAWNSGSSEGEDVGNAHQGAAQPQNAADTISSSVGYVAGGIVGTAAVGTGVALATNVGGITTLFKGAIGLV
ncbi:variant erythrocyte surface antigen-1 family protein [Babesia caballi]|uniref:Variant erythrocyte surface antigen-1 family protein n=1 Tax=Babesia caballi TaxID=5871 RepID=A0AAV4LNY9_BABCB|nr:variant erythrocyte surface antigen-1 family protein [Babesia caballi]